MGLLKFFGIGQRNNELMDEAKKNGALVVDVRTVKEFKGGHVAGSVNIPLDTLSSKIEDIKKMKQPILLCCASGMRSGSATSQLKKMGIECYNAGSWKNL